MISQLAMFSHFLQGAKKQTDALVSLNMFHFSRQTESALSFREYFSTVVSPEENTIPLGKPPNFCRSPTPFFGFHFAEFLSEPGFFFDFDVLLALLQLAP